MKCLLLILAILSFIPLQTDVDQKEYKYSFHPNDKFASVNRSYQTDTLRTESTRRYEYQFWVGEDGINYGTKTRK